MESSLSIFIYVSLVGMVKSQNCRFFFKKGLVEMSVLNLASLWLNRIIKIGECFRQFSRGEEMKKAVEREWHFSIKFSSIDDSA